MGKEVCPAGPAIFARALNRPKHVDVIAVIVFLSDFAMRTRVVKIFSRTSTSVFSGICDSSDALFVMELKTRRVHFAGYTTSPNETWMKQIARNLSDEFKT